MWVRRLDGLRVLVVAAWLCGCGSQAVQYTAETGGRSHEDPRLVAARTAYFEKYDFAGTVQIVRDAVGSLEPHQRAEALRLMGCAHIVLKKRDEAVDAFKRALALEPDQALEPELASPDARAIFEDARAEWKKAADTEMQSHAAERDKIVFNVKAPTRTKGGSAIPITVTVTDVTKLGDHVELGFRRRGQAGFTLMTQRLAPAPAPITFTIPDSITESEKPFTLEYHVTLRAPSGLDLKFKGNPNDPEVVAVAAGHRPRWHESWLVRSAIGLGVVALAGGGYLFYRSIDVGPQDVTVHAP